MLFSELHKIMVNKVTFAGFRGAIAPSWIRPWSSVVSEVTPPGVDSNDVFMVYVPPTRGNRNLATHLGSLTETWKHTHFLSQPSVLGRSTRKSAGNVFSCPVPFHCIRFAFRFVFLLRDFLTGHVCVVFRCPARTPPGLHRRRLVHHDRVLGRVADQEATPGHIARQFAAHHGHRAQRSGALALFEEALWRNDYVGNDVGAKKGPRLNL